MTEVTLEWHGDEVLAALHGATPDGLQLAAEHLLQVSRQQVPHQTGTLERSGTVSVDANPDAPAAAVTYDQPYAVRQHEDLTMRHDQGRKAKYLEDPLNSERDTMLGLIAGPMRDAIGGD